MNFKQRSRFILFYSIFSLSMIFYQAFFLYYQQRHIQIIPKDVDLPDLWTYVYGIMLAQMMEICFVINSMYSTSVEYMFCAIFPLIYISLAILLKYFACHTNVVIDLFLHFGKIFYIFFTYKDIKAHIYWAYYKRLGACYTFLKSYIVHKNLKTLRNLSYLHNTNFLVYYFKSKPQIISYYSLFIIKIEFFSHIFEKNHPVFVNLMSIGIWTIEIFLVFWKLRITYIMYNQ
ncbi:hypothetical protein LUQ84_3563 [Hamiltosporidium tvaerminnensis]|nr:hypothetical protein LUQ84_3563 [Hamiltosporidium tvaerminnensis]